MYSNISAWFTVYIRANLLALPESFAAWKACKKASPALDISPS